ncbi:MAG: endonuclease III domain-containing protein [Candidatus Tectomicrobia bacterium]|nr:endonuclease III domain-containing protein [Candidatus Tectomicrobia bacterium]
MSPRVLMEVYRRLLRRFGPRGWWPAEAPFEVCVGAILVQNTSWANAARAIANLKGRNLLSPETLRDIPAARLSALIRPARFFNMKAERLKTFIRFLWDAHGGSLDRLFRLPTGPLRETLLALKGIGPETADSILLYAAGRPVFVVDAYTHRIFARLGLYAGPSAGREGYAALQGVFHGSLPRKAPLYNEYHALLVELGKEHCRTLPICGSCPLRAICPYPDSVPGRPGVGRGGKRRGGGFGVSLG